MSKCPFCGQPIHMQIFCVNWRTCPSFRGQYKKMQKVLPSKSGTASQHPKGKERGQQPSTARELKKKIAQNRSAVTHPVKSSKQILKVNKASKDSTRQNFGRSGEAQQQASASQGEDRNLHQRMQTLAIGPLGTFGNVAHSRMAPLAAASSYFFPGPSQDPVPQSYNLFGNSQDVAIYQMNPQQNPDYSAAGAMHPAPNPQHVGQNEASASHGTSASGPAVSPMHTDDDASGYCLMCEMFVHNIEQHWRFWHGRYGLEPNPCYVVTEFKSRRMLLCNGTDLERELHECPSCQNVLFIHRFINHHCPVLEQLLGHPLVREIPNRQWGYCLMCKFNFEDLANHRAVMHKDNDNIYSTRPILGRLTLLPKNTWEHMELTLCSSCHMPIYKYQDGIHLCL